MLQQASFPVSTKLPLSNERPEITGLSLDSLYQMKGLSQKPTLTLQVRTCHAGLSSVFHQAEREKGDYVLVMRLIQFIPVLQSTPNSQSSHNCSFRLSQTKRCCWIQVSFLNQIKILCDLHNLFNTDPHHDPSFTSPFFCQQKHVSSLKTDLPRETIRQPASVRVERECISEL